MRSATAVCLPPSQSAMSPMAAIVTAVAVAGMPATALDSSHGGSSRVVGLQVVRNTKSAVERINLAVPPSGTEQTHCAVCDCCARIRETPVSAAALENLHHDDLALPPRRSLGCRPRAHGPTSVGAALFR